MPDRQLPDIFAVKYKKTLKFCCHKRHEMTIVQVAGFDLLIKLLDKS